MTPRIAILMGSDSDFPRLEPCIQTLRDFGQEPVVRVLSAHRTPEEATQFATRAQQDGFGVIICAAGGAAHLAGVIAAHTSLPVLGIPLDNPPLGGLDALLATVQMPGGVPVGTVGVGRGGPINAALLALRILGVADADMHAQMNTFRDSQHDRVLEKDAALQSKLS
jgi:5-(carboxyamino)imidazole ribonucleotide mutase